MLKDGNFSLSAVTADPINVVLLRDSLIAMNESKMFHRGSFAYESFDYATGSGVLYDMSAFQNVLNQFVIEQSISQLYYVDESPKDQYYVNNGFYNANSHSKVKYYLPILFNNDETIADFDEQISEVRRIMEVVSTLTGSYKNINDVTLHYDEINDKYIAYYGDRLADESDL